MFKKILFLSLALMCSVTRANEKLVTVNQYVSHPALDQAYEGIKVALQERKLHPGKVKLQAQNASGNIATAVQIAKHQASLNPAIMIGIATPCAQANLKAKNKDTWLAFVAVTDPQAAGLLTNAQVLGTKDNPPIEELVAILLKTLPKTQRLGIILNPGEINSVKTATILEKICQNKNIQVKKVSITATSQIKTAVAKLTSEVDVIYVPLDNLIASAIEAVTMQAQKANVPVIGNDPSLVDKGVLFALGTDYFQSGKQLGEMIADKIEGMAVKPLIQESAAKQFKFNENTAKALNIPLDRLEKVNT